MYSRAIVQHMKKHPTHVLPLVSGYPDHLVCMNSCKLEISGGIYPGLLAIPFIVWQVGFPKDIQDRPILNSDSDEDITTNDLELSVIVFSITVLELHLHLTYRHIDIFCDNTSVVNLA